MLLFLFGLLLSVESAVNQTVAVLYQSKKAELGAAVCREEYQKGTPLFMSIKAKQ